MQIDQLSDEMDAMANWETHLKEVRQWQEGVSLGEDDYRKGLAEFLGVSEDEITENISDDWQEIPQMSREEFADAVRRG